MAFNPFIDTTKGWDNKRLAWVGACAADAVLSRDLVVTTVPAVKEQSTHSKVWGGCLDFECYFHSFLLCHCCDNLYAIVHKACVTDHSTCHPHLFFCSLLLMSLRWKITCTVESLSCWPPLKIISFFFLSDQLLFILPCHSPCFAFIVKFLKRVRIPRCSH